MFRFTPSVLSLLLLTSGSLSAAPVVLHNIQGYGFDEKGQIAEFSHFVFDNQSGKVLARGDKAAVVAYDKAEQIDGKGQTLLPGLIDGHGHVLGLGQNLNRVDLRTSSSEAQAVAQVAAFAKTHQHSQWILGGGWNQVLWPTQQFPGKTLLDESIKDKPVWLTRVDSHAGWANSKALQLAGITKETIDPPGGEIIRDDEGNPTGVLIDNAMLLLEKHIPEQSEAERLAALDAAFEHLLALGITSVHDAGVDAANLQSYQQLRKDNKLPLRIYAMLSATDPDLADWLKAGPVLDQEDVLVARSVKVYGDGALGSRGAALIEAYSDQPGQKGLFVTQPDKLTAVMKLTLEAGFQTNVHAIGDLTNRLVLDRFEQLASKEQLEQGRHRIEHAQIVSPKDIPRFAELHILPSMQPTHATSDKNMAADRLGIARLRGAYAWKSFVDQGSRIVAGSDFPVELANPFYGIHAAVTRQDQQNQPVGGWLPEQRLTLTQALKAFTLDAAYGAFQDQSMGSLAPGMWADFILVDRDIFKAPAETLWQTKVQQSWVAGQQKYKAQL
ncbi:Putative TIM-barrel fold metal-dependent hydrolase [Rheinheimera sp. A13L]|uniref:amidohydrolase n=1 Tax=Rheinheimera sp. A13L TaxID=506534 RepID=UPI00021249A4|nr:amidohydrolase [Rheinheimera sp. A13L]EGM76030.1 Putative TIM-barrel fold metal-dependent hydrolase [Rheinheimera sp. A13L]